MFLGLLCGLQLASGAPASVPAHVSRHPCTPYDLRKDHGKPYERLPVLDQGMVFQACGAFAEAAFVDGWIQSHLPDPPVPGTPEREALRSHVTSPLVALVRMARDRGLSSFPEEGESFAELNEPERVAEALRRYGSCNHLKMFGRKAGRARADAEILRLFGDSWNQAYAFLKDSSRARALVDQGMSFEQILGMHLAPAARGLHCSLLEKGLDPSDIPGQLMRDTNPALVRLLYDPELSGGGDRMDLMAGYFDHACQGDTIRMPIPEAKREVFYPNQAERTVQRLHELMDRPVKGPLHVLFCAHVLDRPRPFKAYFSGPKGACRTGDAGNTGTHAAVIIGRRREADGSCKVLVRNSWGRGCGLYEVAGWECEEGNVWVDIRDLAENTYQVRHFER